MESSTIFVAGATGFLGNEICRLLRAKNLPVNALVRTTTGTTKIDRLKQLGVQVIPGDLRNEEFL